jgi:putative NADH-flavin reductase
MTQKEFDYLVLGASGHVGSAVLNNLPAGTRRLAAVHNAEKLQLASDPEIERVVTDVADTDALRELFLMTRRAFLLNPPADPSKDTNAEELKTARSIASALEGSGIEKVVIASTYGAQPGNGIGDLSVLFEFERLVNVAEIPTAINRGAYYFTNLDQLFDAARQGGIETPFPPSREMPKPVSTAWRCPRGRGRVRLPWLNTLQRLCHPSSPSPSWHKACFGACRGNCERPSPLGELGGIALRFSSSSTEVVQSSSPYRKVFERGRRWREVRSRPAIVFWKNDDRDWRSPISTMASVYTWSFTYVGQFPIPTACLQQAIANVRQPQDALRCQMGQQFLSRGLDCPIDLGMPDQMPLPADTRRQFRGRGIPAAEERQQRSSGR